MEYEISDAWVELPNAADAVLGHDVDAGSNALPDPPATAADAKKQAAAGARRGET